MRDYRPNKAEQAKFHLSKSKNHSLAATAEKLPALSAESREERRRGNKEKTVESSKKTVVSSFWLFLPVFLLLFLAMLLGVWQLRTWLLERKSIQSDQKILLLRSGKPEALLLFRVKQKRSEWASLVSFSETEKSPSKIAFNPDFPNFFWSMQLGVFLDQSFELHAPFSETTLLEAEFLPEETKNFLKNVPLQQEDFGKTSWWQEGEKAYDCPLSIVNATQQSGLANQLSQVLETANFSVVRKENAKATLGNSQLITDGNSHCRQLVQRLQTAWPFLEVREDASVTQEYRAALVLILGENLLVADSESSN
jgi:hypothetical protein